MPLNYTIPALNTCDASLRYCAAISHVMLYIWQKEECGRKWEKRIYLQQILYYFVERNL